MIYFFVKRSVMIQVENNNPVMLLIFDGFGYRAEREGNAVAAASMKTFNWLCEQYPRMELAAAGRDVGLPDGCSGNSEVGHLNLGAGRIVRTPLCKFHDSIADKSFFQNELVIDRFTRLQKSGKSLHVIGLLSDGGAHAHHDHLYAFLRIAKRVGIQNVFIHPFLDGRDVAPQSAKKYLAQLDDFCKTEKYGVIASLHGRFYAMDRDNNVERTRESYAVLSGKIHALEVSWSDLIDDFYKKNVTDEFITPTLLTDDGVVRTGDGVVFFNFRPDRARQLTQCFLEDPMHLSFFLTTTRYDQKFTNDVLFEDEKISETLLDVFAEKKKNVFIIAETEKYAHVTYFFRGKVDRQLANETRVIVPSLKVKTYVDTPEMSASQITEHLVASLEKNRVSFYLANYANSDMVGHSGNFDATVAALTYLDAQLQILYNEIVEKRNGTLFLVSDHGNAEEMVDEQTGAPKTSHTTNPVPFLIINKRLQGKQLFKKTDRSPRLSSVAPTILSFLGLPIPDSMDRPLVDAF